MKAAIVLIFVLTSTVWAREVETDCPAMNQSREKNPKLADPKVVRAKTKTEKQ